MGKHARERLPCSPLELCLSDSLLSTWPWDSGGPWSSFPRRLAWLLYAYCSWRRRHLGGWARHRHVLFVEPGNRSSLRISCCLISCPWLRSPTPRHANGMSPTFQTDSHHDQLALTPIKRRRTSMTWMEGRNLIPRRHLYRMGRQQAEMAAENSKRWPENRGGRRARQRLWLLEQVEMAGYRRACTRSKASFFHGASWDTSFGWTGKRVDMIGTAVPGFQILAQMQPGDTLSITIYISLPTWISNPFSADLTPASCPRWEVMRKNGVRLADQ